MDEWLENAANYLLGSWGLDPKFAGKIAVLYAYLFFYGLKPRITSGFRDPNKQKMMRAAWDRGDRVGLRARPADPANSKHCRMDSRGKAAALAIDIVSSDEEKAAWIAVQLGLVAGYNFKSRDPGHYEMGGL